MSRIQELLDRKRRDVESRKLTARSISKKLEIPTDDRRMRWSKRRFHLIAEIKRASLSAGSIRPNLRLKSIARAYEKAGVSAISILTEEHYFGGSLQDLKRVRKAILLPLLQKDFIIDPFQILEAKDAGADFVLLIVRFLTKNQLRSLLKLCEEIQINAIVEITNKRDLDKLSDPVAFLGVNSRDLDTLEIDTKKFARLIELLPKESFLIAESTLNPSMRGMMRSSRIRSGFSFCASLTPNSPSSADMT